MSSELMPFITVVMPVRNEASFIRDTLEQLLSQEYPLNCYEIIVADGMSSDGTREIVQEMAQQHPQLSLLDNPKLLSSAGRNVGFRNGRGDYFLVVDGHCYIPDDQLLRNVVDCFEKSGADCLGRPQPLDPPGLTKFQQSVALARGSRLGHGGDSLIYGEYEGFASPVSNGAAYKREVFEKIGYVDEGFDACEDVEFNYRVEHACLICYTSPQLTIRYYPRESLKGLFRQMVRYGKGRRRFTRKHPEAQTVNQLVPAFFVAGLFLLVIFSLMSMASSGQSAAEPRDLEVWKLLALPYIVYVMIILVESVRMAIKMRWSCQPALPLIFFAVHFGLGYGFIAETVKGVFISEKRNAKKIGPPDAQTSRY